MKKIKLTFPYPQWPIFRQFPQSNPCWGDYQFFINPSAKFDINYDYWVVFNFPLNPFEESICRKDGLILITGEPETVEPYSSEYVKQFCRVITSQRKLKHKRKFYLQQGLPWFVDKTFDELLLQEKEKTKMISVISSTKVITDGHKRRLDFVLKLKSYLGDAIDLFGRGLAEFKDKWEVLAPYRYSIAIENTCVNDYFTEKISDCYLAYTFPIYYGCPNLGNYFSPESFANFDLSNFSVTLKKIENLLSNSQHYSQAIPLLKESRNLVLYKYNLFPTIVNFIEQNMVDVADNPFVSYRVETLQKSGTLLKRVKDIFR